MCKYYRCSDWYKIARHFVFFLALVRFFVCFSSFFPDLYVYCNNYALCWLCAVCLMVGKHCCRRAAPAVRCSVQGHVYVFAIPSFVFMHLLALVRRLSLHKSSHFPTSYLYHCLCVQNGLPVLLIQQYNTNNTYASYYSAVLMLMIERVHEYLRVAAVVHFSQ